MKPLKKRILPAFLVLAVISNPLLSVGQTLFTYGTKSVSKEEFLKAFNKNATDVQPGTKEYREYLELYARFKIKVQAALDMKLDTLPNQLSELRSFRSQVASTYMNDDASLNQLIDEAIGRSKREIKVAHIYVALPANAVAAHAKQAESQINEAYSRLQKGEDFGKVAADLSQDPQSASTKGEIGYISVFALPYDLETLAYKTPEGQYSKPYRSNIGWHIFKNVEERPSPGKIRVAQILLSFPPEASAASKLEIEKRADSLYRALQQGADFKDLALHFSNDNLSYQNGGEMMEFSAGRYEPAFENAAFSLVKDGEIAKPVASSFGYHIIRRLSLKPPVTDLNNKSNRDDIRAMIAQNDRMSVTRSMFVKKVMQQTGYKKLPVNQGAFKKVTDSILAGKGFVVVPGIKANTPLFSFQKQTITLNDWARYLETVRNLPSHAGKTNDQHFTEFVETTAMEYYSDHLELYNKEFAYQLKEFKEGNLLFEVMQRMVWDKASADTGGLKKYYDSHKGTYWWETSADALIFTATSDSFANTIKTRLAANPGSWKSLLDSSNGMLQADSGRFELGQIPVVDRTAFKPGLITANVINESDNSATFSYIVKMYNDREPRSFNDARGFVINDYQAYLEEKWIAQLRKKYPVKVNEAVFATLTSGNKSSVKKN